MFDRRSAGELKTLDLRLKPRTKNCGVRRIGKTVAHEHCVLILDIHVELADTVVEEFHDLVFFDELPPRLDCRLLFEAARTPPGMF
jgi:hypothetical protein